MSHIIGRTRPAVMTRAFDAFRASDPVAIGEVFEENGMLVSHVDAKLLSLIGVPEPGKPVRSRGNLRITQFFEQKFSVLRITYTEVHSEVRVGREFSAICDFEAKLLATGQTISARCAGMYSLSPTGRKVENSRTICSLITPGWDYALN